MPGHLSFLGFLENLHALRNVFVLIAVRNHTLLNRDFDDFLGRRQHLRRANTVVKELAAILVVTLLGHLRLQKVIAVQHIRNGHDVRHLIHINLIVGERDDVPLVILLHHNLQVGDQTVSEEHL